MARPSKYETHVKPRLNEIADWVWNGATDEEIAVRLKIGKSAFYEYKREFSEFSDTLKNTRQAVDGEVETALLQSALSGNTAAQIFGLKNAAPSCGVINLKRKTTTSRCRKSMQHGWAHWRMVIHLMFIVVFKAIQFEKHFPFLF